MLAMADEVEGGEEEKQLFPFLGKDGGERRVSGGLISGRFRAPQKPAPGRSGTSDLRAGSWSAGAPTAPKWGMGLGWDVWRTPSRGDEWCSVCHRLRSCREKHWVRCDLELSCCSWPVFQFGDRIVNRVLSYG